MSDSSQSSTGNYYASVNSSGVVVFYHSFIHTDSAIPQGSIQITDEQFTQAMQVDRSLVSIQNGQLVISAPTPVSPSTQLQNAKNTTISQLQIARDSNIQQGFTSSTTNHSYYYTKNDQLEFVKQQVKVMNDPTLTSIAWLTKDAGVVQHTRDQFLALQDDANAWEQQNFTQYQSLESQALSSTTPDEAYSIVWSQITN